MTLQTACDVEQLAFDLIEQRAASVAELLLEMAAQARPLNELATHLRLLAERDGLSEKDCLTLIAALRYARRLLGTASNH